MRILLCHRPGGAFGYITDGVYNALIAAGHTVTRWDGKQTSWDKFDPDIYYCSAGHRQPIPLKRRAKVAIHVNPYGSTAIKGIDETKDAIRWVIKVNPDIVFGYGSQSMSSYWQYWKSKCGIPWVAMPTAADTVVFNDLNIPRTYDIGYIGGRWGYKAKTIDTYLLPLLTAKRRWRVYGWGDWPNGICSGKIPDNAANEFLNSSLIGPCISEIHTHYYGIDIPERAFKVASCGALVIHDNTMSIKELIPSAIACKNPAEMNEIVEYYLTNKEKARQLALQQQREVLQGQTYFHRMSKLFSALGFEQESTRILTYTSRSAV